MLELGAFCTGGLILGVVLAVISGGVYFFQQEQEKLKERQGSG